MNDNRTVTCECGNPKRQIASACMRCLELERLRYTRKSRREMFLNLITRHDGISAWGIRDALKTSVTLTDVDLATLINSTDDEVRQKANAARGRLDAPRSWRDVPPHVAALIADVIAEGKARGRLIYRSVAVSLCRYCGAQSTWEKKRRKTYEAKISGVEFAERFVIVTGYVVVGACRTCVEQALPTLRAELSTFPVQISKQLRVEGCPVYCRWDRCQCKQCGWAGHEGQLGKLRTLMGDGWYQGKCPSCGVERRLFGADPFERLDGFELAKEAA